MRIILGHAAELALSVWVLAIFWLFYDRWDFLDLISRLIHHLYD
jgi:hypothetical protein